MDAMMFAANVEGEGGSLYVGMKFFAFVGDGLFLCRWFACLMGDVCDDLPLSTWRSFRTSWALSFSFAFSLRFLV